ncbi:hypothetical protein EDF36_3728 [Rathayibacter sp. PhB152]|nr:hypothetical protein EDF36_3728 [Rathayibacter sp. PhB152]
MSGCSSTSPSEASHENEPPKTASPLPSIRLLSPTPTPEDVQPVDAEPSPEPSPASRPVAIATEAAVAFCRPTIGYDTWISELYPFLSQRAAVAYETVDPANVPCTSLTGAATVRDGDGAFTMRILVPTDAGVYSVYVHRTTESTPWAVEQITPLALE